MPFSKRCTHITSALLACSCAASVAQMQLSPAQPSLTALREGFAHPPAQARLRCYWWWLNGHTDKPTITRDLEEMKAKGFGGALLVDANGANQTGNENVPAGPTFASPAWIELYTHALKEADRLGLEITLNITSGWNLGGPDVTPDQASKLLTWTRTELAGGASKPLQLPPPATKNGFYRQIAVLAYPLQHGAPLASQPEDRQGDRHTAGQTTPGMSPGRTANTQRSAQTLRFRSAAAESGFSMPDASAMLNDGLGGSSALSSDPGFADTPASAVQDITAHVNSSGLLTWAAPPGEWEVLRIGYTDSDARVSTSSGAWQGLAIDYLSRAAFEKYWNHTVEPLLTAAKPFHSLKYLASDSWELGGTNWTDDFGAQFQRLRGYDPVPWLPVIAGRIVGDRSESTRFLTDLRRTVADLIVSEHYNVFAEKARAHGMGTQAESGGPHGAPIDALETFRDAAVVQTEFWSQNPHRNTDPERFFTKQAASAANIYGQRFVAQEGETSIGPQWSESLATDLKPSFDMAVTEGMNRLVWHEFTSSPAATGLPGQEYFAGTHLNPKVTWWNAGEAFFTYLNRAQFLMQQGTAVNDVLYFYGDNVPNFVRLKADDPAHVLPGYDYDVTDEDALLHSIHMEGGQLRGPSGVTWKLLALPKTGRLSMAVLERVELFLREGGVVVGTAPTSSTGRMTAIQKTSFDTLVAKIWGTACDGSSAHRYGKGKVFCSGDAHAALVSLNVPPDLAFADDRASLPKPSSTAELDYIHRRIGKLDVYFLRNGSEHTSTHDLILRAQGAPQLWNLVSGTTAAFVPSHRLPDGRTEVSLALPPFGSTALVFLDSSTKAFGNAPRTVDAPTTADTSQTFPLEMTGPWSVSFQSGRGGPSSPLEIRDLTSWTEWSAPGARYFSGTATYRAQVIAPALPSNGRVLLHLSDVREIARVRLNGKEAGTIWARPYSLEVGSLLHAGTNTLEIEVTNLWANRLIGDRQPGTTEHITQTNITAYRSDSPLLPSGMIGPVTWELYDTPR